MVVYIKNMVCNRCMNAVKNILQKMDISAACVNLGEVVLERKLKPPEEEELGRELLKAGFELLDDQNEKIIEKIKNLIVQEVHYADVESKENYSIILAKKLNKDYSFLSKLFSETQGITIEKYIINQKTERVKELLKYGELNLNEIAFKTGYSSAAHLSSQFKKVTGLTPGFFKKSLENSRKTLDSI
jgi:AraC family transcriptional regulator